MNTEKPVWTHSFDKSSHQPLPTKRRHGGSLPNTARRRIGALFLIASLLAVPVIARAQGWTLSSNLTLKAELTLKETYDDNVFILNKAPTPGIVPPLGFIVSKPKRESLVTSLMPSLALNYRPSSAFVATLSYAPEFTWYHRARSEDYAAHRAALNFNGQVGEVRYEWLNSAVWLDGSDEGYLTIRPGDCRCIGGIPLRDRRDAAIYRDSLRVTIPAGRWFVRPVVSAYVHDFQTKQYPNLTPTQYLYDNFVDRWDVNGGLDLGYEAFTNTRLVVGYRYGHQEQGRLLGNKSPYSNDYQRFLFGAEGTPASWIKLAILAGPEVRDWPRMTNARFDQDEILWWIDGTITVLPTAADTLVFRVTRFEQPAFTSHSVYEDIKYDVTWRHKFTDKLTVGAGFTLYIGDWQGAVDREDWIYIPSVMASYAFNAHLTAEAAWSYDAAESRVANGPTAPYASGREFTRNLISLAVKYTF